jgi:adenosylcobinamide-GDP ribazoletransferase
LFLGYRDFNSKEYSTTHTFLAAMQFLTGIPVPLKRQLSAEQLGKATAFFPLVGLVIGGILAGLNWVFNLFLPAPVVNILLIISLVALTGAMHLDGFADTCDGMAGHKPVEKRWEVMHDSRTGAFGVVGIALLLITKYVVLDSIPTDLMTATLLLFPVVSRWAMVYAIFAFRYARPQGLGTAYKNATKWPQFVTATVLTMVITGALYPLLGYAGFMVFAGIWLVATILGFYFRYKFAGQTGDTYGATNEVSEVMGLIFVTIIFAVAPNLI